MLFPAQDQIDLELQTKLLAANVYSEFANQKSATAQGTHYHKHCFTLGNHARPKGSCNLMHD